MQERTLTRTLTAALAVLLLTGATAPARHDHAWRSTWGSAQYVPTGDQTLPDGALTDATLRQQVRITAAGAAVRVRLSNAFGTDPLTVDAATVAKAGTPGTAEAAGALPLLFGGRRSVTIPAGAEVTSDRLEMPVSAGATLAISIHTPRAPARLTSHPGSRSASFIARGDHVADSDLPGATRVERWYQLAGVEVFAPASTETIVAIGDSITDGYGVKPDTYRRWTDRLAERLAADAATRRFALVNTGIGGNRVLLDGSGPNLVARFDRDVLSRTGVKTAIVLEGINDLGVLTRDKPATPDQHRAIVTDLTGAFRNLVERAHAHGIRVIGGTVMPFGGNTYYHPGAETEADRQQVNAFIRGAGVFDAVINFDRITRDPAHPDRLNPAYDSGDHLHPSPDGYAAMGDAIPLSIFTRATPPRPRPTIALTFDDMPAHGPLPPGMTRLDVVNGIIAALKRHDAPAFGFVNGKFGEGVPDGDAVLDAWRNAGLPLGNHSWSHDNLASTDLAAFQADTIRGEGPIARRMAGQDWRWFRYPFLSEGATPAQRDTFRAFLARRGYKAAGVSTGFADYDWNPHLAKCLAKNDQAGVRSLKNGVLAAAAVEAWRRRAQSQSLYGRDIPQVMLLHLGALDARIMDRLLDLYASLGFRFVTLAQAESDPFWKTAVDLRLPGPTPSLDAAGPGRDPPVPQPRPDPALCS